MDDRSRRVMTQTKKGRRSDENRNRPRITFTLSPEVIEALRQKTSNMSDFVDRTLRAVLFGEPSELVAILPVKKHAAGRIRTCDHRLNRPTLYQLSYGGSQPKQVGKVSQRAIEFKLYPQIM